MGSTNNAFTFRQALTSAKFERKTGNLHVFTSVSGTLKNAMFVVRSGELICCNYLDKISKNAVHDLLQSVIVKTLFIQRDISGFTPHQGIPSIDDIVIKLLSGQSANSVVQQPAHQSTPLVRPRNAGYLRRVADFLGNVIDEDKARLQIQEITNQFMPDDEVEKFLKNVLISLHHPSGNPLQEKYLGK